MKVKHEDHSNDWSFYDDFTGEYDEHFAKEVDRLSSESIPELLNKLGAKFTNQKLLALTTEDEKTHMVLAIDPDNGTQTYVGIIQNYSEFGIFKKKPLYWFIHIPVLANIKEEK